MAPLGDSTWNSTLNNEPCPSSYILQNSRRRKWPLSADVCVNCFTKLLVFFFNCEKKFAKWDVYFSLLMQEQTVLLCSLEILLFSSCDLTCLNFFEFILPKEKYPDKIWFYNPQVGSIIKHHLSLSICSIVIYPSAITMTKSLCYHHRMTIFQNTWERENLSQ